MLAMLKLIYIFDLDGTLADCTHRLPLLDSNDKDKWENFYAACNKDVPIISVITTLLKLNISSEIWIWTGRSEEVRLQTIQWLLKYLWIIDELPVLRMRSVGDHRPDDVLKQEWLDSVPADMRGRIVGVFEDRQRVVDMWRRNGVQCFQVAPGDF
jgi:hypothetical protein